MFCQTLRESVNVTLEKHAPTEKRYARTTHYMNKKLIKKIIKRSRFKNKVYNTRSGLDRK